MYDRYEQNSIVLSSFCELSYKQRSELTEGMSSEEPKFEECAGNLIKTLGEGVYNKIRDKFNSEKYRESVFTELEEKGITCIAYNSPIIRSRSKRYLARRLCCLQRATRLF